jgi:hypothetical protein
VRDFADGALLRPRLRRQVLCDRLLHRHAR